MCKKTKEKGMFAFIFDSGRLGSGLYGDVVFNAMLSGKEITKNKTQTTIYSGDISICKRFIDIEPYIVNDEFCTIDFDETYQEKDFKDFPFCWVVEDLEHEIASLIDVRLKKDVKGYVGLSKIDLSSTDTRKQFWRELPKDFSIYKNTIVCFQDPDVTDVFCYWESAEKLGFKVKYDKYAEYQEEFNDYTRYKTGDANDKKLEKIDRDLMSLNFSLCRELQIAGSLIWKSINDIDKVCFNLFDLTSLDKENKKQDNTYLLEYSFFTLYHVAQGIERLQKIIVELIYKKHHLKSNEKNTVSDLLYHHNHLRLNNWINNKENISLSSNCEIIFNIAQKFYNKLRYARFSDSNEKNNNCPEFILLQDLGDPKSDNFDYSIKKNFGKLVGEIAHVYFDLVRKLSRNLNIHAYELESDSSATIVFYQDSKNLYEELEHRRQAKKELLYWIMSKAKKNKRYKLIKVKPLNLDEALIDDYLLELIKNPEDGSELIDTVNALYDELCSENKQEWQSRVELIDTLIANPSCRLKDEED